MPAMSGQQGVVGCRPAFCMVIWSQYFDVAVANIYRANAHEAASRRDSNTNRSQCNARRQNGDEAKGPRNRSARPIRGRVDFGGEAVQGALFRTNRAGQSEIVPGAGGRDRDAGARGGDEAIVSWGVVKARHGELCASISYRLMNMLVSAADTVLNRVLLSWSKRGEELPVVASCPGDSHGCTWIFARVLVAATKMAADSER